MMQTLIEQIKRHEGLRLKPYQDTVGKLTIGYGRNLIDKGISRDEAEMLLINDVLHLRHRLTAYPWFLVMNEARQEAITNMAYNLGVRGLLKFKQMIAALDAHDYSLAADEMLNSRWARQVNGRATELASQMRNGWRMCS
jgi:lysozyme